MNKEQIDKLAGDPRFIPGIFNYCDRWCERCQFTSRCLNFALCEEDSASPKTRDINNEAFWQELQETFETTLEMLRETADKMGLNLESVDAEQIAEEENLSRAARQRDCCVAAKAYAKMAGDWLDSAKGLFERKETELTSTAAADLPGINPQADASVITDAVEVICWYMHQIYVKLVRAATGRMRGERSNMEAQFDDSDGSAKVAIIGIERSIGAWGRLLEHFGEHEHEILHILAHLKRLLREVEKEFPKARAFVRPGFDRS